MPGYNLPFLAGVADGLFAEHGLDVAVEAAGCAGEGIRRLAEGDGDVACGATFYHLKAIADSGSIPVRFVTIVHRTNPLAAFVPSTSESRTLADLRGLTVGGRVGGESGWLVREYVAAMGRLHLGPVDIAPMTYKDACHALGRGDIGLIVNYTDHLPTAQRRSGIPLRAIPVGEDTYTTGVLVADHVPPDVALSVHEAVVDTLTRQRADPERGVDRLVAHAPAADPSDAVEAWRRSEASIFTTGSPGTMTAAGWRRTVEHLSAAHGLPPVAPEVLYRADLHPG